MIRRIAACCLSIGVALVVLGGCGSAGDGEPGAASEHESLTLGGPPPSGWFYDDGTKCTVGGVQMHCCPAGYAMIGARIDQNKFKCAKYNGGMFPHPFLDTGTNRNNMHACPQGAIMVGLHANLNDLACVFPQPAVTTEFVDGNPPTDDSYPMHVCPPASLPSDSYAGYAMTGIRIDQNKFTCGF
jgi:hypothetical protein